jgi:hypothetical protein
VNPSHQLPAGGIAIQGIELDRAHQEIVAARVGSLQQARQAGRQWDAAEWFDDVAASYPQGQGHQKYPMDKAQGSGQMQPTVGSIHEQEPE